MKYPESESSVLEFKEMIPKKDQIIKTVIGYCNLYGGRIIIGVDNSGKIVGVPEAELGVPEIEEVEVGVPEAELGAPEAEWEEDIDFIIPLSEDQLYSKILQLEASRYSTKKELEVLKIALKNQKITVEDFENSASVLVKDLDLIERELKRLQNIINSVSK